MKLSLVIPTYNERENIQILLSQLKEEFEKNNIDGEIIIVDDNSPDGTGRIAEELKIEYNNIKVVHRKEKSGLSSAVMEGFSVADGGIYGVMDADLSHPVDKIPEMINAISNKGADLAIGSRYVKGGKIKGWGLKRKILSRGATLLGRFFTKVKDPMSGFFMFKKELILNRDIDSKGFKILLEILIKSKPQNIVEIPITFTDRTEGESKAGSKEIFFYLQNLIKYEKEIILKFLKFSAVGISGTLVNILILFLITEYLNIHYMISAFIGFIVSVSTNFLLNKTWTFHEKVKYKIFKKYRRYFTVSLLAFAVNLIFLFIFTEIIGIYYIISQVLAIGISLIINFITNKSWTFKNEE